MYGITLISYITLMFSRKCVCICLKTCSRVGKYTYIMYVRMCVICIRIYMFCVYVFVYGYKKIFK